MNGEQLKLALDQFESDNKRDAFVNEALTMCAERVPWIDHHAETVAIQIRGLGMVGGRDLLFKLWLYLRDRDQTELLAGKE